MDLRISIAGHAAFAVEARQTAAARDEAESLREAVANALLIVHGESANDALDRLGGVNGVESGEHKVAGFGGFQRDLNRFPVAHLAHQNHLGRLPQRAAQRCAKVGVSLCNSR